MINFRYHIVSLMAVFLALAVGITLGVTLVSDEANQGLAAQADKDRKQVQLYRQQLEQQRALNDYRDNYEKSLGTAATSGMLTGVSVAVITLPDAPRAVVDEVEAGVEDAGGTVAVTADVSADVFDPDQSDALRDLLNQTPKQYRDEDSLSAAFGSVVGRALLSDQGGIADQSAVELGDQLGGRFVRIDRPTEMAAQLAIVVSAPAAEPPLPAEALTQHTEFLLALDQQGQGLVLAGPNSTGVDGTDVATVRAQPRSREELSTVDVADLPSGVSTVVMASAEMINGGQGHYGYANSSDAPAPEQPS